MQSPEGDGKFEARVRSAYEACICLRNGENIRTIMTRLLRVRLSAVVDSKEGLSSKNQR